MCQLPSPKRTISGATKRLSRHSHAGRRDPNRSLAPQWRGCAQEARKTPAGTRCTPPLAHSQSTLHGSIWLSFGQARRARRVLIFFQGEPWASFTPAHCIPRHQHTCHRDPASSAEPILASLPQVSVSERWCPRAVEEPSRCHRDPASTIMKGS